MARWAGLTREDQRKTGVAVAFQTHALMPAIAAIIADDSWTVEERRQAGALYATLALLHSLVLARQQALLVEARTIHADLTEAD